MLRLNVNATVPSYSKAFKRWLVSQGLCPLEQMNGAPTEWGKWRERLLMWSGRKGYTETEEGKTDKPH